MEKTKRYVAYIVRIKDILEGRFVKEEGELAPNYILVKNKQVSRANVMGVVIALDNDIVINDGSGSIALRSFEEKRYEVNVGDIVLVIGRPREFNNERYILPEIVKKIENNKWVELRKSELRLMDLNNKEAIKTEEVVEKAIGVNNTINNADKIFKLIKERDNGDGADISEVISASGVADSEALIKNLLKEGEIFEIRPGRLKVLE